MADPSALFAWACEKAKVRYVVGTIHALRLQKRSGWVGSSGSALHPRGYWAGLIAHPLANLRGWPAGISLPMKQMTLG